MGLRYVPLLLLLLALAGCGSETAGAGSLRLFLAGDGELWVVDPAEAHARHIAMPELGPGDPPYRVVARRDRLVLYGGTTIAVDERLGARRPLGEEGSFFIPATQPDRVWIVELEPGPRAFVQAVREITVDGTVTVPDARPPRGEWPLAAVDDGLLIARPDGGLDLWDPEAGEVVRRLDVDPGGFAATGRNLIASCDEPCKALRLTDAGTGTSRTLAAPDGSAFEPWAAAFSPDGTRLGIAVRGPGGMAAPRELALIDVDERDVDVVRESVVPGGYTFVVWSPSGDGVFITGGERFHPRTLVGYRLGNWRAHTIDVQLGDFYGAAAL